MWLLLPLQLLLLLLLPQYDQIANPYAQLYFVVGTHPNAGAEGACLWGCLWSGCAFCYPYHC